MMGMPMGEITLIGIVAADPSQCPPKLLKYTD
jgi:hypothetical protein